eukprot:Lankesteria_metandrocarpae@DN4760_c0_g1_i5.p1
MATVSRSLAETSRLDESEHSDMCCVPMDMGTLGSTDYLQRSGFTSAAGTGLGHSRVGQYGSEPSVFLNSSKPALPVERSTLSVKQNVSNNSLAVLITNSEHRSSFRSNTERGQRQHSRGSNVDKRLSAAVAPGSEVMGSFTDCNDEDDDTLWFIEDCSSSEVPATAAVLMDDYCNLVHQSSEAKLKTTMASKELWDEVGTPTADITRAIDSPVESVERSRTSIKTTAGNSLQRLIMYCIVFGLIMQYTLHSTFCSTLYTVHYAVHSTQYILQYTLHSTLCSTL